MELNEQCKKLLEEVEEANKIRLDKLLDSVDLDKYNLDYSDNPPVRSMYEPTENNSSPSTSFFNEDLNFINAVHSWKKNPRARNFVNMLSDGQYDDGDMAFIIDDEKEHADAMKDINERLDEVNKYMFKHADRIKKTSDIIENFDLKDFLQEAERESILDPYDIVSNMSEEELEKKAQELRQAVRQRDKDDEDNKEFLGDMMDSIHWHKRIIENIKDFDPKGASSPFNRKKVEPPPRKSLKQQLIDKADLLDMPQEIRNLIKKMEAEECEPGNDLESLIATAKQEGFKQEDLPEFIRTRLMPEYVKGLINKQ